MVGSPIPRYCGSSGFRMSGPPPQLAELRVWSGDLPAAVAEGGNDVQGPTGNADIAADDVDARDVAMLDLANPGLGDAEHLGDLRLGQACGLAHLGQLM